MRPDPAWPSRRRSTIRDRTRRRLRGRYVARTWACSPLLASSFSPPLSACAFPRNSLHSPSPSVPLYLFLLRTVPSGLLLIWSHPPSVPRRCCSSFRRGLRLSSLSLLSFIFFLTPNFELSVTTVVSLLFHRFRSIAMEPAVSMVDIGNELCDNLINQEDREENSLGRAGNYGI